MDMERSKITFKDNKKKENLTIDFQTDAACRKVVLLKTLFEVFGSKFKVLIIFIKKFFFGNHS